MSMTNRKPNGNSNFKAKGNDIGNDALETTVIEINLGEEVDKIK